eukprot:TRINITY_DN7942_c0_g2_i1.p1 TRINITY_DN7942_c0_g2~~TRINITY_DN7942_c0_g2_i1.p1  ORF type:complete len:357 (+),score=99.62 TRINITY_DN7942_c0_g2_i1:88-1158(+)
MAASQSRKAPIPFRPNKTATKYEDWSTAVQRQPAKYPGGLKKSDVGGLPGNLGSVGRHRKRQLVGQRSFPTAAPVDEVPLAKAAETIKAGSIRDAKAFFHEHLKRECGDQEPTASNGVRSAIDNNPPIPKLPYTGPPAMFSASQTIGSLNGSLSATKDFSLTQAPRDLSVIRSLRLGKQRAQPHLAHLESQVENGLVLRSAPAGAEKPERKPVALPPTAPDSSFRPAALPPCHGPVLPPPIQPKTRLGANQYPRTYHLVQNEADSAGFAPTADLFRETSRGLDTTWQKEGKLKRAMVGEHRVARKAYNEHEVQRRAFKSSTDCDAMELARAAARAKLKDSYTHGVAHTEGFRQKQR